MLYLLRMQRERMTEALVPSLREYSARFGLTTERARRLAKHALVMHPGPMNRGVEILVDPSELPGAVITQQVANGVAVRMAVLFELLERGTRRRGDRMSIVIRGGLVVDRERRTAGRRPRRRRRTSSTSGVDSSASEELDAGGCVVAPGFVDLHVHLREPGHEEAETIETGSRAAALGGFTAIVAMPNTDPPQDTPGVVELVRALGEAAGLCEVLPAGCITRRPQRRDARPVRRAGRGRCADLHRRRQRRAGPAADAAGDGVRRAASTSCSPNTARSPGSPNGR